MEKLKFSKLRTACPACGSSDGFAQVSGAEPGVGKCFSCDVFFPPSKPPPQFLPVGKSPKFAPPKLAPVTDVAAAFDPGRYERNALAVWLRGFGVQFEAAPGLGLGTGRDGSAVFVHREPGGAVRYLKAVVYGPNGKRDRSRAPFGLTPAAEGYAIPVFLAGKFDPARVTVLVESEKTAILCGNFLPRFNWVATAGANGLSERKAAELATWLGPGGVVRICPDNDPAGAGGARLSVERLQRAGVKNCKIVSVTSFVPDAAPKSDLADIFAAALLESAARNAIPPKTGQTSPTNGETSAGDRETRLRKIESLLRDFHYFDLARAETFEATVSGCLFCVEMYFGVASVTPEVAAPVREAAAVLWAERR